MFFFHRLLFPSFSFTSRFAVDAHDTAVLRNHLLHRVNHKKVIRVHTGNQMLNRMIGTNDKTKRNTEMKTKKKSNYIMIIIEWILFPFHFFSSLLYSF